MTRTEAVELLWKVKVDGEAQLASVERATRGANGAVVEGANALQRYDSAGRSTNRTLDDLRDRFAALRTSAAGAAAQVSDQASALGKAAPQVGGLVAQVSQLDTVLKLALGTDIVLSWVRTALGMAEAIGQVRNEWDPVIRAEREALKVAEDLRHEYAQLGREQEKLLLRRVERREGRSGRLRFEAGQEEAEAERFVGAEIAGLQARIVQTQERVRRGTLNDLWGPRLTADARAAEEALRGLNAQLEAAVLKQQVARERTRDLRAEADDVERNDAKKAADEARREQQRAEELVRSLEERANSAGLRGVQLLNVQREAAIEKLGRTAALVERVRSAYEKLIVAEQGSAVEKAKKEGVEALDRETKPVEALLAERLKVNERNFLRGLKEEISEGEKDVRRLAGALQTLDRIDEDRVRRAARKAERMTTLAAGPGGELRAIEEAYEIRLRLARELEAIELRRAERADDAEERLKAIAEARYAREKAEDEARTEREISYLELRRRSLDQYRDAAGRVFDAATASGRGGLADFGRNQLRVLERQLFVNASAEIFQKGGQVLGRVGEASGLGRLLAGTVFDPNNATPVERNTASMKGLTESVKGLDYTLRGVAAGIPAGDGGAAVPFGGLGGLLPVRGTLQGAARILNELGVPTGKLLGKSEAFFAGAGSVLSGGLFAGLRSGDYSVQVGPGRAMTASSLGLTSTAGRVGNLVGSAALVAGGGFGVAAGIREGGGKGAATAAASALGVAAAIPGPQQPFLQAAALVAGLVRGLFRDSKETRDAEITGMLNRARYAEARGVERFIDRYGQDLDYDRRGAVRVVENVTIQVQALDAKSVLDRAEDIADATRLAVRRGHDLADTMRDLVVRN
ncbi:MAG: hypothetical protein K2X35_05450 [Bryobacteraceae bacterium]|nr:hypothetical protein [Bryobacteraceae bacterium]